MFSNFELSVTGGARLTFEMFKEALLLLSCRLTPSLSSAASFENLITKFIKPIVIITDDVASNYDGEHIAGNIVGGVDEKKLKVKIESSGLGETYVSFSPLSKRDNKFKTDLHDEFKEGAF